jgi:type VI secretion system protein ImpE
MYRAALNAERERREFFKNKTYVDSSPPNEGLTETPSAPAPEMSATPPGGTYNEKPFREISDADPRIGDRLEVFVAGRYLWVPFAHIASVQMEPPKRLRDLLWAPALIRNGENFKGRDLGEVMIPVLSPFTCTNSDDAVRLGRATVWEESDGVEIPFGQKMLLIDGEEVPLLELRNLQMDATREPAAAG